MDDLKEFVIVIGVAALALCGLFLVIGMPIYFLDKVACEDYANSLNFEYKHNIRNGCIIKTESGWIKSKNYIINKEEK